MENSTPTISKELQEQIEREAEQYMLEWNRFPKGELSSGRLYEAYLSGATAYAHYEERCNELERWKEAANLVLSPLLEYGQSKEADIPLGRSITEVILQRAKQFEEARKALHGILQFCEDNGAPVDGFRFREEAINAKALLASWKEEGKGGNNG